MSHIKIERTFFFSEQKQQMVPVPYRNNYALKGQRRQQDYYVLSTVIGGLEISK
jgi:hypothetical protein